MSLCCFYEESKKDAFFPEKYLSGRAGCAVWGLCVAADHNPQSFCVGKIGECLEREKKALQKLELVAEEQRRVQHYYDYLSLFKFATANSYNSMYF